MTKTNNLARRIEYRKGCLVAFLYIEKNGKVTTMVGEGSKPKTDLHCSKTKAMRHLRKLGYLKVSEWRAN